MPINATDIQAMVTHWLGCPPNGYLGSTYGSDLNSLLQSPQSSKLADQAVAKLRVDIPIIGRLDGDMVNVYAAPRGVDQLLLGIDVAGSFVEMDQGDGRVSQG